MVSRHPLQWRPRDARLGQGSVRARFRLPLIVQTCELAAHGLVGGELQEFAKAKAEPALVLTIPDKPSDLDDGLLEASELAKLKLNADWVVLSACNTASSDGVGAEPYPDLPALSSMPGVSPWSYRTGMLATRLRPR